MAKGSRDTRKQPAAAGRLPGSSSARPLPCDACASSSDNCRRISAPMRYRPAARCNRKLLMIVRASRVSASGELSSGSLASTDWLGANTASATIPSSAAASHGTATFGGSPSVSPAAATNSGEGVSPAAAPPPADRRPARPPPPPGPRPPFPRVRLQTTLDDALHGRVQILHQRGDAGRGRALLHLHQFHQRRRLECALSREQLIQQQPQRVDVAPDGDSVPASCSGDM